VFYGAMHATKGASLRAPSWFAAPDQDGAKARPRRPARPRRARDGQTSVRAIIASSAFLVLFSATLMVGGHAAIDPLLRSAMAARETRELGDIVVAMSDGKFCRHMSFDNATAEIVEGKVGPCPDNVTKGQFRTYRSFAWGSGSAADSQR
jgi:hypothetical protein